MSVAVGPFAFSLNVFLLMLGFLTALVVGWLAGRKRGVSVEPVLTSMLLLGLLAARAVFVLLYLEDYLARPSSILNLADGGFSYTAGIAVAAATGAVCAWRRSTVRKPLGIALVTGVLTWGATAGAIGLMHVSQANLSDMVFTSLSGKRTPLARFEGRPMVVNLWATWCPPCRREMPVLADAQEAEEDMVFLFINQGEGRHIIHRYLRAEKLTLDNVLLDTDSAAMRQLGTGGLPSTFFINADGELVDTHFGELSAATLKQNLESIRP